MSTEPVSIDIPRSRWRLFAGLGQMSTATVWTLTALIAAGLAYYHWRYEGWRETIIFASAITASLVAALTLMTRRILFAIAVVASIIAMIVVASDVKRHYIEMVLHAYDVVFYLTSSADPEFPLGRPSGRAYGNCCLVRGHGDTRHWSLPLRQLAYFAPGQRRRPRFLHRHRNLGQLRQRRAEKYPVLLG